MAVNSYTANFKPWDHLGAVTPNFEYSEAHRPHGEFMPAAWLPVQRFDNHYETYYSVSAGKIVALDKLNRVVPAGLKKAFAATSGDVLAYTAADATYGVLDLATGARAVAGAAYTRAELTAALIARGLIDAGKNAEDFISYPVGCASYNYFVWAGGDGFNPALFNFHNFILQSRVAIVCKYVIEVPVVPAAHGGVSLSGLTTTSSAITDWTPATSVWVLNAGLVATTRYADVGANVVGLNLAVANLAKSTVTTPVSLPTGFTTERASASEISQAGDYFVDYDVGVILVFESGGDAVAVATGTVGFYYYQALPASVSTFVCALGELNPGDFVCADANSNFVKAKEFAAADITTSSDGSPSDAELATMLNQACAAQREIIGQVLDSDIHPKDYLERVRTPAGTGAAGTATQGLVAALPLSGGSNKMLRILLLK